MEKKIYASIIFLSSVIILITSLVLSFLFYDIYRDLPDALTLADLFLVILPAMVAILVLILIGTYFIAARLSGVILEPIYSATKKIESILSGEDVDDEPVYDELKPFMETIQLQKNEIEYSIQRLKELEKYRREFSANVTHELKTPLTSINGYAEVIASGMAGEEEIKKFANIILKEGTRLLDLINQILDLSKIESETMSRNLYFEEVDLYEVVRNLIPRYEQMAAEKNIKINLKGNSTIIDGNKSLIEDLISNLMDNAIKYNKRDGKVDVNILRSGNRAHINVRDTGMGISKEDQERVFERFYRVDKSRSQKITGTGIGLSIVKHIVEYHNGEININSKVGKGTEIKIAFKI